MIICGFLGVRPGPEDMSRRVEAYDPACANATSLVLDDLSLSFIELGLTGRAPAVTRTRSAAVLADLVSADGVDGPEDLLRAFGQRGLLSFAETSAQGAVALWNDDARCLHLWRAPMSTRPWYWRRARDGIAFANAIPLLRERGDSLDRTFLANAAVWAWNEPDRTPFDDVFSVPPGHVATFVDGRITIQPTWRASDIRPIGTVERDVLDLRRAFDDSVRCAIDGAGHLVASQLSAGRDSSAVTCVAASLAGPQRLIALTAAPARGFDGPDQGDESAQAAETAARVGVRHLVVRAEGKGFAARLDRLTALFGAPLGNLPALNWWDELAAAAKREGADRILVGELGNYSINSGGPDAVRSLLDEGYYAAFVRALLPITRSLGLLRTLSLLLPKLAMSAPARGARALMRGQSLSESRTLFLKGELRNASRKAERRAWGAGGFSASYRRRMAQILERTDCQDMPTMISHRVDFRDPTADRGLVEAILQVPATALVSGAKVRPLFGSLFEDVVPETVLDHKVRGQQGADWYRQFPPDEVAAALERYASAPLVREWVDLDAMGRFLAQWPTSHAESVPLQPRAMDFLNALGLAAFLHWEMSTRPS